jgi:chorismate-pyruvate lyase
MTIPEESTQDNIQQLLNSLPPNLTPVERVLLCHDGTNQTLLSILFDTPVKVQVLSQLELIPYQVIIRWIKLVAEYSDENKVTVCLAESVIPMKANSPGFLNAIKEQNMGIGQILSATGINYERRIFGLYADENIVARNYQITGEGVDLVITETFSRKALKKAGGMV